MCQGTLDSPSARVLSTSIRWCDRPCRTRDKSATYVKSHIVWLVKWPPAPLHAASKYVYSIKLGSYQYEDAGLSIVPPKRQPKPDPVKPRSPAARRFYFTELAVPLVYIFISSHSSPTLLMQLRSQATIEIHHAALSSLPRPLRLRPPGSALLAS